MRVPKKQRGVIEVGINPRRLIYCAGRPRVLFGPSWACFCSFFGVYGFKCGLSGLLVSAEPRKMRAVAHKLGRSVHHMFCCALAGGFWAHPFLKSTCTYFVGGGLVQVVLERHCGRW